MCVCEESVGRWVGSCACVRRVWVGEWGHVRVCEEGVGR